MQSFMSERKYKCQKRLIFEISGRLYYMRALFTGTIFIVCHQPFARRLANPYFCFSGQKYNSKNRKVMLLIKSLCAAVLETTGVSRNQSATVAFERSCQNKLLRSNNYDVNVIAN